MSQQDIDEKLAEQAIVNKRFEAIEARLVALEDIEGIKAADIPNEKSVLTGEPLVSGVSEAATE